MLISKKTVVKNESSTVYTTLRALNIHSS